MGDNGAVADPAILLRSLRRLTGALAAAGRDDDNTTGELFFRLHLLYGVPQFANLSRHVPRRSCECQPSIRIVRKRAAISGDRHPENAELKCVDAFRGILSGAWKSLGKSNNSV
ncbi:hypothetical protein SS05631_c12380 [Sinorhizobium sp. CCBAU 05631]|nr:hypothetical protein SS05631_c12380 [Sinorhizobium sp. CCBAU 05631]